VSGTLSRATLMLMLVMMLVLVVVLLLLLPSKPTLRPCLGM